VLGQDVIGYIETEILDEGERMWRHGGWAEAGNLRVAAPYRRPGVGTWLLGQAADWLRLAQVTRLLDYAWLEGTDPAGQLPGLPGLPGRRGLPRAHPHRARVDQERLTCHPRRERYPGGNGIQRPSRGRGRAV
jgi:GNAT superfamily N-acetyltransferase